MCTVLEHQADRGHIVRRLADAYEDHKMQISDLVKQVEDKVTLSKTVMMETEDEMRNLEQYGPDQLGALKLCTFCTRVCCKFLIHNNIPRLVHHDLGGRMFHFARRVQEMRNLDKKQTDITKEIDHEVDEGIHMLEIRRRELKDTLKEKCKKKRSVLQSQREGLKYGG
jgi:hypothetical protein